MSKPTIWIGDIEFQSCKRFVWWQGFKQENKVSILCLNPYELSLIAQLLSGSYPFSSMIQRKKSFLSKPLIQTIKLLKLRLKLGDQMHVRWFSNHIQYNIIVRQQLFNHLQFKNTHFNLFLGWFRGTSDNIQKNHKKWQKRNESFSNRWQI